MQRWVGVDDTVHSCTGQFMRDDMPLAKPTETLLTCEVSIGRDFRCLPRPMEQATATPTWALGVQAPWFGRACWAFFVDMRRDIV